MMVSFAAQKQQILFWGLILLIGLMISACTSGIMTASKGEVSSTKETQPPKPIEPSQKADEMTATKEPSLTSPTSPGERPTLSASTDSVTKEPFSPSLNPPLPATTPPPLVREVEFRKPAESQAKIPVRQARSPIVSSTPGKSCVNSECHSTMGKEKYVHGPVAVGECIACHVPVNEQEMYDVKKHRFELAAEGQDLCYICHDERKDTQRVVHGPVRFGLCTACHDPHQSPYRYRLKAAPPSQLCFKCHVNDKTIEKEVHGPVGVGDCVACHDPHTTPYQYRLIKQGKDLCYTCHTEKQEEFSTKKFEHPPARDDCSNCHDPHTSPNPYRLHRSVPDLCFGCHPDKKDHIQTVKTEHDAYKIEKKCLNCHDPHFTDYPKQLKDVPMNLCLQCHDREQQAPDRKLVNIKNVLEENPDWHGPIRQKDCPACHNPHGTDNFRLLKRPFPPDFYTGFEMEKYALCFGCHEKTLVEEPSTKTLTGFRNGEKNLHFQHVNRITKGRTCRACHDFHATKNPKHIRDSSPFGSWAIPTNYVKYKNGGKCAPGCHVPRGYDRVTPAQNPIDYLTFTAD